MILSLLIVGISTEVGTWCSSRCPFQRIFSQVKAKMLKVDCSRKPGKEDIVSLDDASLLRNASDVHSSLRWTLLFMEFFNQQIYSVPNCETTLRYVEIFPHSWIFASISQTLVKNSERKYIRSQHMSKNICHTISWIPWVRWARRLSAIGHKISYIPWLT